MTARLAYAIQRGADYGLLCFWILILVGGDRPTTTYFYSFLLQAVGEGQETARCVRMETTIVWLLSG